MKIDYDTLFCLVDDFCKGFEPWYKKQLISDGTAKRNRSCHLSLAETLTILIAYHQSGMACFKYFYLDLFEFPSKAFS
jgi:cytochrome b